MSLVASTYESSSDEDDEDAISRKERARAVEHTGAISRGGRVERPLYGQVLPSTSVPLPCRDLYSRSGSSSVSLHTPPVYAGPDVPLNGSYGSSLSMGPAPGPLPLHQEHSQIGSFYQDNHNFSFPSFTSQAALEDIGSYRGECGLTASRHSLQCPPRPQRASCLLENRGDNAFSPANPTIRECFNRTARYMYTQSVDSIPPLVEGHYRSKRKRRTLEAGGLQAQSHTQNRSASTEEDDGVLTIEGAKEEFSALAERMREVTASMPFTLRKAIHHYNSQRKAQSRSSSVSKSSLQDKETDRNAQKSDDQKDLPRSIGCSLPGTQPVFAVSESRVRSGGRGSEGAKRARHCVIGGKKAKTSTIEPLKVEYTQERSEGSIAGTSSGVDAHFTDRAMKTDPQTHLDTNKNTFSDTANDCEGLIAGDTQSSGAVSPRSGKGDSRESPRRKRKRGRIVNYLEKAQNDPRNAVGPKLPTHVVARLSGHSKCVGCVEWSPKVGRLLLSASMDGKICFWDVFRESEGVLDGQNPREWSATGHAESRTNSVWAGGVVGPGTNDEGLRRGGGGGGGGQQVSSLQHSHLMVSSGRGLWKGGEIGPSTGQDLGEERQRATGDQDRRRRVFYPVAEISSHEAGVKAAKWNYDGSKVLSGGYDKTVRLHDVCTGQEVALFPHTHFVTALSFHPSDSNLFLSGKEKGGIQAWDVRCKEVVRHYKAESGQVQDLCFLPASSSAPFEVDCDPLWQRRLAHRSRWFVSSSTIVRRSALDKGIVVWDFDSGAMISNQVFMEAFSCPAVKVHPAGQTFVAQSTGDYVAIFNTKKTFKLNKRKRFEGHKISGFPCGISFNRSGSVLAAGDSIGNVHFYDFQSSRALKRLSVFSRYALSVAPVLDGHSQASVSPRSQPVIGLDFHPVLDSTLAAGGWQGETVVLR